MVMFFHFLQHHTHESGVLGKIAKLAFFGQTGVTLFFVLSGFLITRILIASKNQDSFFKTFYVRRSLRIFPLYFLFLALYYFVMPMVSKTPDVPFYQQWPYWVYLQNFAVTFNWDAIGPLHFWSLAVEEHFYLFWPFIIYYCSVANVKRVIVGIIALAFLLRVLLFLNGYEVFYFTFTNMDTLALGSLLAVQEYRATGFFKSKRQFLWIFVISLLLTLVLWFVTSGSALLSVQAVKNLLLGLVYYGFLGFVYLSEQGAWHNKLLRLGFLRFTGKISYGLYVYHPLCFGLLRLGGGTGNIGIDMVLAFSLSYAVASTSYFVFEAHFLKLKKYFEY